MAGISFKMENNLGLINHLFFDCFKKSKLTSRSIFSAATASKFLAAKYKKESVLLYWNWFLVRAIDCASIETGRVCFEKEDFTSGTFI